MEKQSQIFFLPMTQDAIDAIARHLDLEIAKPLFDLLEYRQKNVLANDDIVRLYPGLFDIQRNYLFDLNRMRKELHQLYELTPPIIQKQIQMQLKEAVRLVENMTSKKKVLKELQDSNQFIYTHIPGPGGKLITYRGEREESEYLSERFFSSSLLDDYVLVIRTMSDYFKIIAAPFINVDVEQIGDSFEFPSDFSLYSEDDIHAHIIDWKAFISKCEDYSQPHSYSWIKRGAEKKSVLNVIKKLPGTDNYKWEGIPKAPIPSLRSFIKMLLKANIFKLANSTQQGIAFYKFFHIDKSDPSYLLEDLFVKNNPDYDDCFILNEV
jgi:hypothetical protein